MQTLKILYLYSEVMGYNLPIFASLAHDHQAEVHVVHWDQNKLTPFVPEPIEGVQYYARSTFSTTQLIEFATKLKPDLIYVSGWMDQAYLKVCEQLKKRAVPIVVGFDSQWTGSLRQRLGSLLIRYQYKRRYFSYACVPGPLQAAYAGHIGFKQAEIIPNLLSGNHALFSQAAQALETEKLEAYPKRFLYVGRFAEMKGLDILLQAYNIYKDKYAGTWGLTCIGNGPLRDLLAADPTIEVEDFMSQRALVQQAQQAGALILPSRFEPWGVVVHEFAAAGLPLILSENVGARAQFLVENLNGYTSHRNCPHDLAEKMHLLSTCDQATLIAMGHKSRALAGALTPRIAANSLLSALKPKVSRR